jgi:hypothetical protein
MRNRGVTKIVEDAAGFYTPKLPVRIDAEYLMHVLRHVHHNRDIAALARKARASATAQQRSLELTGYVHRSDDIVNVHRQHHTDRDLAVVGAIGRIERTAAAIEANFAANAPAQRGSERIGISVPWTS